MKTITSFGLVLIAGVLFFAGAKQVSAGQSQEIYSNSLADGGRIRMKHSPVLGINIPIEVWIDGVLMGSFAKGHVFERHLTPGRHDVYAARPGPGRRGDSYHGTLDVRRGETLSFVVKCTPNRVVLQPVGYVDQATGSSEPI